MSQMPTAPEPLPNPHDVFDGHGRYSPEHLICVRCGSSNLAQGQIVDYGDKFRDVLFAPRRVSLRWLNSVLAILPFRALVKTSAIACRDCGLVQLTIDPSELRHAERCRD
jgi:ribosomal protein L40E